MSNEERDAVILDKIIQYCDEVQQACAFFGNTQDAFEHNVLFRNACGMCIIQIGELAGRLSEKTQRQIASIPWRLIRGMRNTFAHNYGSMDVHATWLTLAQDIPILKQACEQYLHTKD